MQQVNLIKKKLKNGLHRRSYQETSGRWRECPKGQDQRGRGRRNGNVHIRFLLTYKVLG